MAGLGDMLGKGAFAEVTPDLVSAVLEEGAKLAADLLDPLNRSGDQQGATLENGVVRVPAGFANAYRQWREAGWAGLSAAPEFGGQGLPLALGTAMQEMWNSANMSFSLAGILSQGAVEAISVHGTEEQKRLYLEKLVSGEWTGTMNLTEPQAGSDLNALKTKAQPNGDGTYRITGTKIFITFGEHDMVGNILHLVLARLPDAPAGTKGISLFLVPKFLVNPDGTLGARNDLACVGLEEKLGIHASPTCVMSFGEKGGAIGTLIGTENRGLACMFTMMNNARLLIGVQGVAIAERAYQHALAYAQERRQGRPTGSPLPPGEMSPIIEHPDIRRMLLTMKALADASRGICYANAIAIDKAHHGETEEIKKEGQARADLLTPVAKAFSTDIANEAASLGVQIHGGMGFIEETGAAQYFRDARILPIYEGTNGIQANDLVMRKLPLGHGAVAGEFIGEMDATAQHAEGSEDERLQVLGASLRKGIEVLRETTNYMLAQIKSAPDDCLAGAVPYLRLFGTVAGGHFLLRAAIGAASDNQSSASARLEIATFYAAHILAPACALDAAIMAGTAAIAPSGSRVFEV
jgi:alkylation response protein AidB-like acyl-CoA dehydrogenase